MLWKQLLFLWDLALWNETLGLSRSDVCVWEGIYWLRRAIFQLYEVIVLVSYLLGKNTSLSLSLGKTYLRGLFPYLGYLGCRN